MLNVAISSEILHPRDCFSTVELSFVELGVALFLH
jgi:hypothetical protein